MRDRIPLYHQPLTAAVRMMPIFRMRALWIVADVDEVEPGGHITRPVLRPRFRGVARLGKFTVVALAAERTINPNHRSSPTEPRDTDRHPALR